MFQAVTDSVQVEQVAVRLGEAAETVPDFREHLAQGDFLVAQNEHAIIVATPAPWKALVASAGPHAALADLLAGVRDASDSLVWDEPVLPLAPETLASLGFRRVLRESFIQDLTKLPVDDTPQQAGIEYRRCEGHLTGPARRLFGRTHALSIEGAYVTMPTVPTARACEEAFEADFTSEQLIASSAIAACDTATQEVLGVIYCARHEGDAMLLGLAVDPEARGRKLARGLVRRTQHALQDEGFTRMHFLTTDRNLPVHKLFTPEEIISTEVFPVWFGMRDLLTRAWRR